MIKERVSLPKGNDGVFSVFVYKQAQEIHGSIGQEILRQNREALNLSEVQNLSVKAKNTFSGKLKELPYHIKNDSEHPNLLFVEFPKELQEIASFNLIIEFDIPLESLADKLLHRLVELPFVEITKSTEKAPMVEDVVFVADVVPAIIGEKGERGEQGLQGIQGEKGERGEQGLQGIQGEKGERGQDGINGTNGENGRDGRDGEKGKSALELLNEENSTQHSSITEALKTLMPKESSESKIYERVMANSIYTIIRNILEDSNLNQGLRDPFWCFYMKMLKYCNIKKLQKITPDETGLDPDYIPPVCFRPIIDTTPLFMDTEKSNDYDLQPFVTFVEYDFHYNEEEGNKPDPIPVLPFSNFTGVKYELKEDLAFDIIVSLPFVGKLDDKATFYIKIQDPDHTIYNKLKSIEKGIFDGSSFSFHNYIDVDLIIDEDLSSYDSDKKIGNIVFKSRD